jgi:hypothetical protein
MEVTMAIHIRVYPQYGAAGLGGYGSSYGAYGLGGYNALAVQNRLSQQQLQNERRVSSLQLGYERQLWEQRLQMVQLQAQAQAASRGVIYPGSYPYGVGGVATGGWGLGSLSTLNPFSSSGLFSNLGLDSFGLDNLL